MKRIYTYILLMACAMIFAGCQKEFDGIFEAEIENFHGSNGKVYLNDDYYACWLTTSTSTTCEYVKGYVNDNSQSSSALVSFQPSGKAKIEFYSATIKSGDMVVAHYPNDNSVSKNSIQTNPISEGASFHTQHYIEVTEGDKTVQYIKAPMVAKTQVSNGNKLKFYNLMGLIQLNITNNTETAINNPTIKLSNPNVMLGGTLTYTQEINQAPTDIQLDDNKTKLNHIQIGTYDYTINPGETKTIYAYVIPNQECAYTVEIFGYNQSMIFNKTTKPITIPRNTIAKLPISIGNPPSDPRGTGSENDPYQITTADQLVSLMQGEGLSKYYKLMNDIDLTTMTNWATFKGFGVYNYRPENNHPFTGTFDGNGYTITNGTSTNASQSGVFENVAGCTIKNLKINANIITPDANKGGLINFISSSTNPTTIENCIVDGSIKATYVIGGLIGNANSVTLNLKRCINRANTNGNSIIGGLIGNTSGTINITNCINKGNLTSTDNLNGNVGGLIGNIVGGPNITIQNSYVLGELNSNDALGGIIGFIPAIDTTTITIENVYIDPDLTQTTSKQDCTCAIVGAYTAGNSVTFNGDNVFVPNSFIQTNEAGGIIKKLYGVAQPGGDLKDNVTAIPNNLLERLQDGQYGHADWSAWVDDVIGNGTNQPGLDFEGTVGQP